MRLSVDQLDPVPDGQGLLLQMPYFFIHQGIPYYQWHSQDHERRRNKFGNLSRTTSQQTDRMKLDWWFLSMIRIPPVCPLVVNSDIFVACDRIARFYPHESEIKHLLYMPESTNPDWRPYFRDFRIVPYEHDDKSHLTLDNPNVVKNNYGLKPIACF